jgi:transcriptional regulator with XRE-family HTH domain
MGQFLVKISYVKDFPNVGQKIKEYRQKSGKSLAQLAADAGISVPHWNRVENEKVRELPLTTLRAIEKALDVDLEVKFND